MLLLILLVLFSVPASADASASFYAEFVDVGAGDCMLMGCDGYTIMVDTGPSSALAQVSEALSRNKVSMIDCLILTHPHPDHTGNLDYITDRYAVGTVILSGAADYGPDIRNSRKMFRGDTLTFGDLVMTAVWPDETPLPLINDRSLVFSVSYEGFTMLLAADAETEAESVMVAGRHSVSLKADLLKAGHHGMATSSTWPFVMAVQPEYAIISCAGPDKTATLSPLTVENLSDAGTSLILSTMNNGNIRVEINDRQLTISTRR
ncbi:MAG: MBL fold metallo-hydrolase [Clostridia bacterium]|nr:MBL fold metallo-hydrolase [Clostridia bacterium]